MKIDFQQLLVKRTLLIGLLAFVVLYSLAAWPFVLNSSMQNTSYVIASQSISYDQVPNPINLYLSPSESYTLSVVQQVGSGEVYAVISLQAAQAPSGHVYLSSQTTQWYVQSNPDPIVASGVSYDRIVIGTLSSVPQNSISNGEYWISHTSSGALLLQFSTGVVYVGPVVLLAILGIFLRRFAVWTLLVALWVYDLVFLIPSFLGSKYGLQISGTLEILAIGLLILVYVVSKLETSVRVRLAARRY